LEAGGAGLCGELVVDVTGPDGLIHLGHIETKRVLSALAFSLVKTDAVSI
jgi:hypothetical protein